MAEKTTLIELHLHHTGDFEIGSGLGFGAGGSNTSEGSEDVEDLEGEEADEESGNGMAILVGLVFLVAVAAAVKYMLGGEEYEDVELEEFEG